MANQEAASFQRLIATTADEWSAGAERVRRVALVTCGSSSDVKPFVELTADLGVPPAPADGLLERIVDNGIYFRANYARALVIWCGICAVRHPFYTFWLAIVLGAAFHALVVRRGVVHLTPPSFVAAASAAGGQSPLVTLMYPRLHVALAAAGTLLLLLVGCLSFPVWLLLPPLSLALVHASARSPPRRSEAQRLATELSLSLHAALRGEEVDVDELEGGSDDAAFDTVPGRSDVMSRRVEAIREKYRPPRAHKRNVD